MNLESKRGDNIEKYIKDMRKEIIWNTDVNVTLKVDEHIDDAGPSGLQTKIEETLINYKDNVTSVSYEHQALPEMKSMEEDSEENGQDHRSRAGVLGEPRGEMREGQDQDRHFEPLPNDGRTTLGEGGSLPDLPNNSNHH